MKKLEAQIRSIVKQETESLAERLTEILSLDEQGAYAAFGVGKNKKLHLYVSLSNNEALNDYIDWGQFVKANMEGRELHELEKIKAGAELLLNAVTRQIQRETLPA